SRTASHQHQHEQELLLRFAVPSPPVATKQLTLAAGHDAAGTGPAAETPRTLWMGDLDPWLDEAAIVALWWHVLGQHVGVKVIRPRSARQGGATSAPPAHAGYCFVEFPLFEAAQQALGLNGQMLPDMAMPSQREFPDNPDNQKKYFRLNWAAGATLLAPLVELPEYSLFVGDLSAATTEAHLLLFFQKLFPNSIRTVRVMTDPVSGKSRCFGFVRFSDEHERQRALVEMNGAWFGGRPLRVANATPRAAPLLRRMLPDPRLAYAVPGPYAGVPDLPQGELMYMPPAQQGASSPMQGYYAAPMMGNEGPHAPYVDSGNTTVFVGGLLAEVSDQTLYTLFKPFGAIVQIKLPPGKNCGFVRYSSREEAQNAINSMEGFVIGGRRVRLGWGRIGPSNKKFQQHQQHQQQMAQMQMQAAMSLAYDPSSVYAAAGYPPMPGVPVGPPGMYHYLP
ncbi:RNA-binding domain-containing protein, partial [Metschnikowia bicuspidata var. bicuspidata NRRL YB-4993]